MFLIRTYHKFDDGIYSLHLVLNQAMLYIRACDIGKVLKIKNLSANLPQEEHVWINGFNVSKDYMIGGAFQTIFISETYLHKLIDISPLRDDIKSWLQNISLTLIKLSKIPFRQIKMYDAMADLREMFENIEDFRQHRIFNKFGTWEDYLELERIMENSGDKIKIFQPVECYNFTTGLFDYYGSS
ncbi:hypothetical protein DLEV_093 [Diachasmimorpha longicaudata entomopoxvirus]|uniref:Uncharacterized protein n=1 Tax=Diachasmimorpha longicaudata entomopoxvirus TaxID=109981 RepID=A0A7R5WMI2_9POXV|nr:hypothetical protein QKK69_gp093 [Diachasmimorpha longicaudata entomopoxvirus]AKS26384.1 hypothetical protein DLEV_093 [Diachasmimorpha longicaudata entomopoxvirus]